MGNELPRVTYQCSPSGPLVQVSGRPPGVAGPETPLFGAQVLLKPRAGPSCSPSLYHRSTTGVVWRNMQPVYCTRATGKGEKGTGGGGGGGGRGGSEPPSLGSPPCRASRTRYYSPLAASVHQPSTPPRHHSTTAHGTSTSPQHTVTAHGHTILYLAGAGAVPGVHLGHLGLQVAAVVAVPLGEAPCPAHAVRVGPGPPQHSHSTATAQPHHSHSTPSDRKHQSRNIPLGTKHRALSTTHGHCVACARGAMWPRTPCAKWSITMSHKDG